ncbi:hypothetical protein Tco_0152186 [Tanacetum coccineum]
MGNRIRTRNSLDILLGMILHFEFLRKSVLKRRQNARFEFNTRLFRYPTQSTNLLNPPYEPSPADNFQLDSGSSSTENLIESLSNSLSLLTQSYKSYLPQTNNQLRMSSNARNKATVQDGRVVVQDDSDYFKDKMLLMQVQENGAVVDEEQSLFLVGE